jgi:hypothetical protein
MCAIADMLVVVIQVAVVFVTSFCNFRAAQVSLAGYPYHHVPQQLPQFRACGPSRGRVTCPRICYSHQTKGELRGKEELRDRRFHSRISSEGLQNGNEHT